MPFYLKVYALSLVAFLAIDSVWLGFIARSFYRERLGHLLADDPNWWAAIVFYALFVAGVVVFCTAPALSAGSVEKAIYLGAFFGLVTYATYDLTNHATVKNWPAIVTVVDLVWGAILSATVSCAGYYAGKWLQTP